MQIVSGRCTPSMTLFLQKSFAAPKLLRVARETLGCELDNPFMALSFLALPVIPHLKLTDRGLVDVGKFDFVPLFVEQD